MYFWRFTTVLITHAFNMGWIEILEFTINGVAHKILHRFAIVDLSEAATMSTNRLSGITVVFRRKIHKARAMCSHILNSCEESLQLHIGNMKSKINEDWVTIFKMLSLKIMQVSKGEIRLARTSLHAVTLGDFIDNA